MTHQRDRLNDYVNTHPGTHFNALTRELDLAPGQVQYHLKKLRRNDDVVEDQLYGRTHYYPPGYDDWERAAIALLRRETARDILMYLLETGESRPGTVADDLDIARSTLEWQLDRLIEQNLVTKQRDMQNNVTLELTQPTETVRMLRQISPSFSNRMVDRFIRLVENLLTE